MIDSLGFLGVGTLSLALIRGLRRRHPRLHIHLSPRSESITRMLVEADPFVTRHVCNADVVNSCEGVVLGMRPPQLGAVAGLPFRKNQIILSCLAATSVKQVEAHGAPASVCRILPMPAVERGEGPIILYRAPPAVMSLLEGVGDLIGARSEAEMVAYSAPTFVMSTYLLLQNTLIEWIVSAGGDKAAAADCVTSIMGALANTARLSKASELSKLVIEHETLGGMNERVRSSLEMDGWFQALSSALDATTRLSGSQLTPSRSQ